LDFVTLKAGAFGVKGMPHSGGGSSLVQILRCFGERAAALALVLMCILRVDSCSYPFAFALHTRNRTEEHLDDSGGHKFFLRVHIAAGSACAAFGSGNHYHSQIASRANQLAVLGNLSSHSLVLSTPVESDVRFARNPSHSAAVETTGVASNFWRALAASDGGTHNPSSLAVVAF